MSKFIKRMLIMIFTILMIIGIASVSNAAEDVIVALDPGHGGNDSGAVGGNLVEKELTWKIATRVKEILDAEPGITGVLTKDYNESLDRETRARRALANGADLLVSFHINSNGSSNSLSGAEVYITHDTTQKRFYEYSNILGLDILQNLRNVGVPSHSSKPLTRVGADWDVYQDGVIADYYGIISWPMHLGIPGMIIEHAFINNPYDRANYLNDNMLNKMAEADAKAIIENKELFRIDKTKNTVQAVLNNIYYDSNTGSVKGTLLYDELINNRVFDQTNPIVNLVSTDGRVKVQGSVTKDAAYTYSYDINIMNLDPYKEYVLQVETPNKGAIPYNSTLNLSLPTGRLGTIYGMEIDIENNKMKFNAPPYDGYVNAYSLSDITTNGDRIEGRLVVQEWLNGVTQEEPKTNPKVMLVAEDGTEINCEVGFIEPYVYGFSCKNQYIDKSKKYEVYVESGTDKNISSHRKVKIEYNDKQIGFLDVYTVSIVNGKLQFVYDGYITSSEYSEITLKGRNVSGQLLVQEWLNGTEQIEPTTLPKLVIKNNTGTEVKELIMTYVEPYVYSYNIDIGDLQQGEYTFELQGTNPANTSNHQKIIINFKNKELGRLGNNEIKILDNKLVIESESTNYDGYMTSSEYKNVTLNGSKISGQLVVQEWLNGTEQIEPTTLPKLVIKNNTGTEVKELTMTYVEPYVYSYSIDISDLSDGEYLYEVQGTNPNNISNHQKVEIQLNSQEVGQIGNKEIKVQSGKLVIEEVDNSYDGYMTSSEYKNVRLDGSKISGQLVVQEWLNGTKQIRPQTLPKLVIKNSSGVEVKEVIMTYVEPYVYSYSIDISNLSDGEYLYEVQGTNPNNISTHQKVEIQLNSQEVGQIGNKEIKVQSGKLVIEEVDNSYDGYMTSSEYKNVRLDGSKISGQLVVQEWLNGTKQIRPQTLPKLVIKNSSGVEVKEVIMTYVEPYVYSYSIDISNLSDGEYLYEVQGTNPNNISTHQKVEIQLNSQEVGQIGNKEIKVQSGKLVIEEVDNSYDGYMTSSEYKNVRLDGSKISGQLVVQEWLNGTKQIRPQTLPKLVIKNSLGVEVKEVIMTYVEPYVYSYSIDISNLGDGEYLYEVQGTNPNNISNHQNVIVELKDKALGNIGNYEVKIINGKLVIAEIEKKSKEVQNTIINIEEDKKQEEKESKEVEVTEDKKQEELLNSNELQKEKVVDVKE